MKTKGLCFWRFENHCLRWQVQFLQHNRSENWRNNLHSNCSSFHEIKKKPKPKNIDITRSIIVMKLFSCSGSHYLCVIPLFFIPQGSPEYQEHRRKIGNNCSIRNMTTYWEILGQCTGECNCAFSLKQFILQRLQLCSSHWEAPHSASWFYL